MVRIASRKQIGQTGTIVSSVSGVSLGSGSSAGNTSTVTNVQGTSVITPGSSVNQLSGSGVSLGSGSSAVAPASPDSQNTNTEYKLSLASMLLAIKNQALGALSLGGSKTGGSVTKNISGIYLG